MNSQKLYLQPFENALTRLQEGFARYQTDISDSQIRDGLIQRYEFTYKISHKMLKRYLESTSPNPEIFDAMPFADLIRSGNEQALLLGDWTRWKLFREMRAKSSHTYDEGIALEVISVIPDFIIEAKTLFERLKQKNA